MSAPTLDAEMLDLINAQAREARPGRALLALIGGILVAVGWSAAQIFRVLFLSGAWVFVGLRLGWRKARGEPLNGPSLQQLLAENAQLRAELSRVS